MNIHQLLHQPLMSKLGNGRVVDSAQNNIAGLLQTDYSKRLAVPKQEYADILSGYFLVLGLQPDIIVDDSVDFIYRRLKGVP